MTSLVVSFGEHKFSFATEKGVFSPNQLDLGSRILLETVQDKAKFVMDLGCGYGAIGIIYAKLHSESFVTLLDNDPAAVELAKINAESNNINNIKIIKADVTYSTLPQKFDLILSNPPWTKNLSVTPKLVEFAFNHLAAGGKFYLVINKTFRTEDYLLSAFGNATVVADRPPYKVLQGIKTDQSVNNLASWTKESLEKLKIKLDPLRGQYFLTNSALISKLVTAADLSKRDSVLEIGPGLGTITAELAKKAGIVTAIEIEPKFKPTLHQLPKNVTLIFDDFFKVFKGKTAPVKFNKIVANLPFMAAGAIMKNLQRFPFDCAVVIVPEKFAEKLPAEKLFDIPRSFFYPMPDTNSVAVSLENRSQGHKGGAVNSTGLLERPGEVVPTSFFRR